jgi:hypothetical protein
VNESTVRDVAQAFSLQHRLQPMKKQPERRLKPTRQTKVRATKAM